MAGQSPRRLELMVGQSAPSDKPLPTRRGRIAPTLAGAGAEPYIEGYDARFLAEEKTRRGIDFKKAFGVLSDDKKEVLLLVGAEGFSYAEASEITGAAVGTVKSRVNRARAALTKSLGLVAGEHFNSNAEFIGLVRAAPAVVSG